MRTSLIACACLLSLVGSAFAQSPTVSAIPSPTPSAAISVSPSGELSDKISQRIEQKLRKHHHGIVLDGDKGDKGRSEDFPEWAVPIVAIVFMTIFGAPVLIVAVIMYFGFSRNRMMHRTIRLMVEKGQPVPPALLSPAPAAVRQRSDMRRGVVLVMIGLGLMLFFGAVNDWEGGAWAIGVVPFLIGLGYLLVWKLEGKKDVSSPPPLP
jgi:hypothetical protein